MQVPVLKLKDLSVGYRNRREADKTVLPNITLELNRGELVCLIGPNGAGKSTLLRSSAGLQPVLKGSVELSGKDIRNISESARAKNISIVLTDHVDAGMITVFSLVSLGRYPYTPFSGKLSPEDVKAVHNALDAAGAAELAERAVNTLSDGERQKVMIARALAQDTEVIILDEPTAFLDLPRRTEVLGLLKKLTRETGKAILLSTHDLHLAMRNADKIWLIGRDGRVHSGAPEDLVLNRKIEEAFTGKNIRFDRYHGSFVNLIEAEGRAMLSGSGLHAVWLKKALERAGYEVEHIKPGEEGRAEPAAGIILAVTSSEDEAFSCTLTEYNKKTVFSSIEELVNSLRD